MKHKRNPSNPVGLPVEFIQMAFVGKVLGEGLRITETLQCRVHEAGVAQVAEARRSFLCGFYNEKWHSVSLADDL